VSAVAGDAVDGGAHLHDCGCPIPSLQHDLGALATT
jgi:hypothetical protein